MNEEDEWDNLPENDEVPLWGSLGETMAHPENHSEEDETWLGITPISDSIEILSLEDMEVEVGDIIVVEGLTGSHEVVEVWEDEMCSAVCGSSKTTVRFSDILMLNDKTII